MAYYTTTAAQFDPYSLQDLLTPLTLYKSRWDELEKSYEDLDSKAALLEAQASGDPKTAQMYAAYKEALLAGRDAMMNGLSNKDTANLLNAKRAYNSNVLPIAEAVAARTGDSEAWRKQKISDPSLLGDDPMSKPLSGYLYGNRPELHNVSGNTLYSKAKDAAHNISMRYFTTNEGRLFKGAYYNLITEKGFSPEYAARTLIQSGNFPSLTEFYTNLLDSEGVGSLSDVDQMRASEYVLSGMDAGFAREVEMKPLQNPYLKTGSSKSGNTGTGNGNITSQVQAVRKDTISTLGGKYSVKEIKDRKNWFDSNFGKAIVGGGTKPSMYDYKNINAPTDRIKPTFSQNETENIKSVSFDQIESELKKYNKMFGTNYKLVHRTKNNSYQIGWKDDTGKWHYNELHPDDKPVEVFTSGHAGYTVSPNVTTSNYANIDNSIQNNITAIWANNNVPIFNEDGKKLKKKDMENIDMSSIHYIGADYDNDNVKLHIQYKIGDELYTGTIMPEAFLPASTPVQAYDVNGQIFEESAADYINRLNDLAASGDYENALGGLGVLNVAVINHANTRTPGQSGTNEKLAALLGESPYGAYLETNEYYTK